MGRRIVRRGAVIASRGSMCNTQSVHCHGQLSADQYAQQPQAARQRCVTIHRAHTRYSTCVGEPSPKPQLVAMKKGSTGSIRPDSLRLKPSQMDQDLHEQIVRSTSGNGKQTCNEVCSHLATQGVYGGLLAGQPNCLQPQFSESSLNPNQVDWLLSQPDLFGDLSPSGPAWVLWEGAKSSSSSQEQQQQQQQPSIAEDTTGAMKTRLPGCSTKKAKGKEKLSRACRQLLSGVVSGIGKMSRRVVKTAVKGISTTKQSGYSVGHVACCFMFCAIQQATQRRFRHPGIALSLGLYGFTLLLATIGQGTVNDAVQLGR